MRFAYSTINWGPTCDIEAATKEIAEAGWCAVELYGHSLDWLGPPDSLRAELSDLTVATFFSSFGLPSTRESLQTHKRRIDYAAELGAEAYGLVGGQRLRWRPPTDDEYQDLATFGAKLADHAARKNVQVCYHPHTACTVETADEIERILIDGSELRLCLDASHIALVGEDPIEVMERFWDRLGYIHLKDWAYGKFVEMGQGTIGIDFPAILEHLNQRGFGRWVVVEQSRSDVSPLQSARENADYLTSRGYALQTH